MFHTLFLAGGAFWLAAYLLIIRVSARDRTYGMPLIGVAVNISWEFVYSAIHPYPGGLHPIVVGWLLLDLVIVYQTLRYGPRQFPTLTRRHFYAIPVLAAAIAAPMILAVHDTFGDIWGVHAAYLDNLMFSAMYLSMLYSRRSTAGQSMGIAITKLTGTALVSLAFGLYPPLFAGSPLLLILFVSCLVLDTVYLVALNRMRTTEASHATRTSLEIYSSLAPADAQHTYNGIINQFPV